MVRVVLDNDVLIQVYGMIIPNNSNYKDLSNMQKIRFLMENKEIEAIITHQISDEFKHCRSNNNIDKQKKFDFFYHNYLKIFKPDPNQIALIGSLTAKYDECYIESIKRRPFGKEVGDRSIYIDSLVGGFERITTQNISDYSDRRHIQHINKEVFGYERNIEINTPQQFLDKHFSNYPEQPPRNSVVVNQNSSMQYAIIETNNGVQDNQIDAEINIDKNEE